MARFFVLLALCLLAASEAKLLRKSLNLREGKFMVALDKHLKTKMLMQTHSKLDEGSGGGQPPGDPQGHIGTGEG